MVDEKKLFELIDNLKNNFDRHNIDDYNKTLFIVYNSMFLDNEVPMSTKYKIFSLLDHILYGEDHPRECRKKEDLENHSLELECCNDESKNSKVEFDELHKRNGKSASWDSLYDDIVSWRLRQNELYSFTVTDEGE